MMDIFKKYLIMKYEHYKMLVKVFYSFIKYNLYKIYSLLALYMNNPLPKIAFIIVKKRHNTRFFVQDLNTGTMNNVQPGTVIDTDIVHPEGFDFYLNSHASIQGRFDFSKINFFSKDLFYFKEHRGQFYIMFYMMKLVFHRMRYNL